METADSGVVRAGLAEIWPRAAQIGQWLARSLQKRVDRRAQRQCHAQWVLLCGPCDEQARACPEPVALGVIEPPPDRFWADPFLHTQDGRTCIFFEELPFASGRGHISALEVDQLGRPIADAKAVIQADHHLSYPFLFEFGGDLYMAPESCGARRLDLYRCRNFPFDWVYERTLMNGQAVVDATLFEHEKRWWVLCSMRAGQMRPNNSLCAFYGESPLGDRWQAHPLNPLVQSFATARPAGALFRDTRNRLLRPSQNCVPRYGFGLNLSEVVEFTTETYRERLVWQTTGPRAGGWRALHHMHWCDGLMVMDAQRLIAKPDVGSA